MGGSSDMTGGGVALVIADDGQDAAPVVLVGKLDGGPKADLTARRLAGRVDDLGRLHHLGEVGEPPVDLPQLLAAVDVVAVLRPVAVGGGPGNRLDQLGAF